MLQKVPGYNVVTDEIKSKTTKNSYVKYNGGFVQPAVTTSSATLTLDNQHDVYIFTNTSSNITVTVSNTINDYTSNSNNKSKRNICLRFDATSSSADRTLTLSIPNTFSIVNGSTTRKIIKGKVNTFYLEIINNTISYADNNTSYDMRLPYVFSNVAEMKAATSLYVGASCMTEGYYEAGDGGASFYSIRADNNDTDDGGSIIILDNGLVAELITDGTVNVKQFGAKADGVTDDVTAFQNALTFANTVVVPSGTYYLDSVVNFAKDGQKLIGEGNAELLCHTDTQVLYADGLSNLEVSNLYFNGTGNTKRQTTPPALLFENCTDVLVSHNKFKNILFGSVIYFRTCNGVKALYNDIDTYFYAGIMCLSGTCNAVVNYNRVVNGQGQFSGNRYPICLSAVEGIFPVGEQPDACNLEAGHNYVEDTTPQWEGIDIHGGNRVWIHDNVVINTMVGIATVENSRTAEHIFQNVIIENNYIEPATVYDAGLDAGNGAMNIVGEDGSSNNVIIANNIIKNANHKGGNYWGGIRLGNIKNCIITNNKINAFNVGIRFVGYLSDTKIVDNIITINVLIDNTLAGIINYSATIKNIEIYNNHIDSATEYALNRGFNDDFTNTTGVDTPVIERGNTFGNVTIKRRLCHWWRTEATSYGITNKKVGIKGDVVKNETSSGNNDAWLCTVSADPANNVAPTWIAINQCSYDKALTVAPDYIGEITISGGNIYMAKGLTAADWVQIS